MSTVMFFISFFFNDTATTEIYTLSLHDALPICPGPRQSNQSCILTIVTCQFRSEEHTSELQSPCNLVCRLLLEKKNNNSNQQPQVRLSTRLNAPRPAVRRERLAARVADESLVRTVVLQSVSYFIFFFF